jgi:hypothetical protein
MTPDRIRRAAEILRREAGLFVKPGSDDHIEMLALAAELEALAVQKIAAARLCASITADLVDAGGQT